MHNSPVMLSLLRVFSVKENQENKMTSRLNTLYSDVAIMGLDSDPPSSPITSLSLSLFPSFPGRVDVG
jgi:hypothetical protein